MKERYFSKVNTIINFIEVNPYLGYIFAKFRCKNFHFLKLVWLLRRYVSIRMCIREWQMIEVLIKEIETNGGSR